MLIDGVPARISDKILVADTGCWLWQGAYGGSMSYGQTWFEGRLQYVHCVIYRLLKGPIPSGYEIDHLCQIALCCNPDHLEAVTHSVNVKRSAAWHHVVKRWSEATHCNRGHPFSEDNVYVEPNGKRRCKECKRARLKRHRSGLVFPVEAFL